MTHIKFAAPWLSIVVLTSSFFPIGCSLPSQSLRGNSGEAEREATKFWEHSLTKCGDSYVARGSNDPDDIWEWKSARIEVVSQQLTEADRLNGFEWVGRTHVAYQGYRRCGERGCGNWLPYEGSGVVAKDFWKRNGKWEGNDIPYKKMDCSSLPKSMR